MKFYETKREQLYFGWLIVALFYLFLVSVWYWNTGDDYSNGYREGYCAAQHAKFVSPNLCISGDDVVSVWTE